MRSWRKIFRRIPHLFAAAACLGLGAAQGPRAQLQVTEKASREGFPLERRFLDKRGPSLKAVGVYLRVRDGAKLYALCLYVDTKALAALTKKEDRRPERMAELLVKGRVAHAFIARFVQPLSRESRMAFLLGHLKAYWPRGVFDPESPAVKHFLPFFDRPIQKGAETQVWMDAKGDIFTREVPGKSVRTSDPDLCEAFTASYLGEHPMDPLLKTDLLSELPSVVEVEDLLATPVAQPKPGH